MRIFDLAMGHTYLFLMQNHLLFMLLLSSCSFRTVSGTDTEPLTQEAGLSREGKITCVFGIIGVLCLGFLIDPPKYWEIDCKVILEKLKKKDDNVFIRSFRSRSWTKVKEILRDEKADYHINARDRDGMNALFYAISDRQLPIVKELVNKGINVHTQGGILYFTPIQWANIRKSDLRNDATEADRKNAEEIIKVLISHKKDKRVSASYQDSAS